MKIMIRFCAFLLVAVLCFAISTPSLAAEVFGKVYVTDGDGVKIDNYKVRLQGLDAPEMGQRCLTSDGKSWYCGHEARSFLIDLLDGAVDIKCTWSEKDKYGRLLGHCYLPDGRCINELMVSNGWAKAYRYYSEEYIPQEEAAQKNKVGIWKRGHFKNPWDWRKEQKLHSKKRRKGKNK